MNNFLETLGSWISSYNDYVGVYAIIFLLIPTGIYFVIRLRLLQVFQFPHAIKIIMGKYDDPKETGDISHFRALTTALSATIGTGNIGGVALAIFAGGPGAVFWMWITGFLGMINKYVECTLSLKYREVHEDGSVSGGPMYTIEKGLTAKLGGFAKALAIFFALGTILCSLGTGNMAQSNSIADVLYTNYNITKWITGLGCAIIVFLVIVGGIKRIAQVTSKLVPVMAVFYIAAAIIVIFVNFTRLPDAFGLIFSEAFTTRGMAGGFLGSSFFLAMRYGIARGLFSNEAGQGSAAIAHAAAKTQYPAREGLVASVGPFIDTLMICTMTALVIILTGVYKMDIEGASMTALAFSEGLSKVGLMGIGEHIVAVGLVLFAISTSISWSYYGDRAVVYLVGRKAVIPYRIIYCIFTYLGANFTIKLVWQFVDMVITFMTIPNLITMLLLGGVVVAETKKYFNNRT